MRHVFAHNPNGVTNHTMKHRGVKMKQSITMMGLAMALATTASTGALAKKCDVVGFWTATITGTTTTVAGFEMTTDKKGVSPYPNPECKSETSAIKSTLITTTNWDTTIKSKKCKVVITTATTFAPGSCSSASGTLTIPGVETLPITVTEVGGAKPPSRAPSRAAPALISGLK